MGDRNNPIKFGPEWLRNLSREPSAGASGPNNHNSPPGCPVNNTSGSQGPSTGTMMGPSFGNMTGPNAGMMMGPNFGALTPTGPSAAPASSQVAATAFSGVGSIACGPPIPGTSSSGTQRIKTNNNVPKVQLAKLRYGREEMLALYDRSAESPEELKHFDVLYQSRGKPPFALNNTFVEEARDTVRGGPVIGVMSQPERYSLGRGGGGIGRGAVCNEARGKSRMPFVRQTSVGRGNASWHVNTTRMPNYNTGPEEDATLRPWNNSNGGAQANRTSSEPPEWNANKMFRRRPNNNTNWRQPQTRDETDEWRSQDIPRNRPSVEKWDRDWGERPNQDRQPWNSNRRSWIGNEAQNNDDNLPEWAVDNAEAGAGTFDSSGAFHGYSIDDTNLPTSDETPFPLARSHTHGSFSHTKTTEDVSEEWWTSEKANKLSAKRIDSGDSKFIQGSAFGSPEGRSSFIPSAGRDVKEDDLHDELDKSKEENVDLAQSPKAIDNTGDDNIQNKIFVHQYQDTKPFETLVRSEIGLGVSTDERNNFQSMLITANSGLRQNHQNLVVGAMNPHHQQHRGTGLLQMIHMPMNQPSDNDNNDRAEEQLVEKILDMTLEDTKLQTPLMVQMHPSSLNQGIPNQIINPSLQLQMGNQVIPNHTLALKSVPNMQMGGFQPAMQPMQNVGLPNAMNSPIQNAGIHNSVLNSSLGLPLGPGNAGLVMPIPGVPPPIIPNSGMQGRIGFQPVGGMPMIPGANMGNPSLYMPPNNPPPMPSNEIQMPNTNPQSNLFPMHPLQHSASQGPFGSMYSQPPPPIGTDPNLVDAWYYEDPEKIIQGPFTSKEMYNWYRAGFFSPSLMVRRSCEAHLRPLGSYGPVVPFIQLDMPPPFPITPPYDRRCQQPIGIEDSLWSQPPPPPPAADMIWMQQMNPRNESRINNLPMFFWDSQGSSAISSNSLLPEDIVKEMKTEDQILAQLRASQKLATPPNVSFMNDTPSALVADASVNLIKPEESFPANVSATPNMEELQKLIQPETLTPPAQYSVLEPEPESDSQDESEETEIQEKLFNIEPAPKRDTPPVVIAKQHQTQPKSSDIKALKLAKSETEKNSKKENVTTKGKNKKTKEEKKEDAAEVIKTKEDDTPLKAEKRSAESSPTKNKKEEKLTKKEQDKEKKAFAQELLKDGFTIVKAADKTSNKENKKKAEEAKALAAAAEEAERKKKEDEKWAIEEEKQRKIAEAIKKAQEQQQLRQDCLTKKAPWSVSALGMATNKDGLTLAEIQRLEREKKMEQIKEQQQMMHIIAQQQAAAMAREQEMQAGLGWAKKKASNSNVSGQSLAEIQAETRKAAAAAAATAAAAAAQALDESPLATMSHMPWATTHNGGFWETQMNLSAKMEKAAESAKTTDNGKAKKKPTINNTKKETTPTLEFEAWCTNILSSFSSKIDVPTFVGFLKDIESPYEVKDYVKCYLGDTKDSNDFARQFLERRSKLLRVGMVTPSDDLCSPAMAINPRNTNLGDYQEVKGKGKKAKKNKMLKVDARILGFSVTAAEDRINVGDIDTV